MQISTEQVERSNFNNFRNNVYANFMLFVPCIYLQLIHRPTNAFNCTPLIEKKLPENDTPVSKDVGD